MSPAGPLYPPEFRADAVRRLHSGDTTVAELSRELGVSESTLRRWRVQADDEHGEAAGLTADEPSRLSEPEGGSRPLRPPARSAPSTIYEGEVRRRIALGFTGSGRPAHMLAGLAAEAIDVGVAVVTAPAKWVASGLRWYARRGGVASATRDG